MEDDRRSSGTGVRDKGCTRTVALVVSTLLSGDVLLRTPIIGDIIAITLIVGAAAPCPEGNECNRLITTVTQRRYQSLVAIGAELGRTHSQRIY